MVQASALERSRSKQGQKWKKMMMIGDTRSGSEADGGWLRYDPKTLSQVPNHCFEDDSDESDVYWCVCSIWRLVYLKKKKKRKKKTGC